MLVVYVPHAQALHAVLAGIAWYWPALHSVQVATPSTRLPCMPAWQFVQNAWPSRPAVCFPSWHCVHAGLGVAVSEAYWPAGHASQSMRPSVVVAG